MWLYLKTNCGGIYTYRSDGTDFSQFASINWPHIIVLYGKFIVYLIYTDKIYLAVELFSEIIHKCFNYFYEFDV